MNRVFVLVLIAGISVAAGCSPQPAAPPAPAAQPAASPAPADQSTASPAAAGQPVAAPVPLARPDDLHAPVPATANQPGAAPAPAGRPAAAPATAVVAESVTGFPDYPDAVRTAFGQRAGDERGIATRKVEASWTSTAPFATVVAFYQKAITERGWVATSAESKATKAEWKIAKGTSTAKIEVEAGVGPQVKIKIERSDR